MIETARGPVEALALGATLMHEHLFVLDHELEVTFPGRFGVDRDRAVDDAVAKLSELARHGFGTLVDLTVLGMGRDIELIRRAAEQTSINIVVATGAYVFRDLPFPLQLRGPGRTMLGGPEPLVDLFVRDITEGIGGSAIKAAIIKCATDRFGLTKDVERTLRAVAHAHLITGVPITTHTNAKARVGLDQQRVFVEEGVDLGRVVIGHCGDTDDLDYLESVIGAGSYIGMDRFGLDYFQPLNARLDVVAQLCARGHAGRIVLSHDSSCHNIGYDEAEFAALVPQHDLTLIAREVIPGLLRRGVSQDQLDQMLIHNPREILSGGR